MAEGDVAESRAGKDCWHSPAPASDYLMGEEACLGTIDGHHDVADEEIRLRDGGVLLLVLRNLKEIEYGWWSLHTEQSAHDARESAQRPLREDVGTHLYAVGEEPEICCSEDESDAENVAQSVAAKDGKQLYGVETDHDKRDEDRQKTPPRDERVVADDENQRSHRCQYARQCRRLTVGRHDVGQYGHDEYAESETCGALYEGGTHGE